MPLTFRTKVLAVVGIAAFAFILVITTGALIARRVERQLSTIYGQYLPRLELAPELEGQFERLRRAFQDAVASRDSDNLASASELKDGFLERLDAAHGAVDPTEATTLRASLGEYCATAHEVSRRLIAGETGESLVTAIAGMQADQVEVERLIKTTAAFDRRELAAAFASAANAARAATLYQLAICAACLVSVLVLASGLSRGVLRNLSALDHGFARFGKGDFTQPIPVTSGDEFGELARHANQMATSLEELGRERDRAEDALRAANRELEAFSYSVAHDLRAPLRSINGFSLALMEDSADKLDDEAKDQLHRIAAGARRMGELIDALLALARVSRGEIHGERVDLAEIARTVLKQLQSNDPDRAVELAAPATVFGHGDPPLLRAVLENLLGNAWKFTRGQPLGRIELGSEDNGGATVYYVRDNGAGFDMKYSAKLFAPFQRLHNESDFAGTGIGLATVQRIINRHGGRIWAEGEVGRGAAFFFTLSESGGDKS